MPDTPSPAPLPHVIDPTDLEVTLRVLASLSDVDEDNPDFTAVRNATAAMIKAVKHRRRKDRRAAIAAAAGAATARAASVVMRSLGECMPGSLRPGAWRPLGVL